MTFLEEITNRATEVDQPLHLLRDLSSDLDVDWPSLLGLFTKRGLRNLILELGHRAQPSYQILSGRLLMYLHQLKTCTTIEDYLTTYDHCLNPSVKRALKQYSPFWNGLLQDAEAVVGQLKKDFMAVDSLIHNYLLRTSYRDCPKESLALSLIRETVQQHANQITSSGNQEQLDTESCKTVFWQLWSEYYTHASPTKIRSGTTKPQLSSCFLTQCPDSVGGIGKLISDIFHISHLNGGIGCDVSQIRHSEISYIGHSKGVPALLQVCNASLLYADQTGRRKGAGTFFLRPHHCDVEDFCQMTVKSNDLTNKAPNINLCIWSSWLFWQRVKMGGDWSLFCPNKSPSLDQVYGFAFEEAYLACEQDLTIPRQTIKARDLLSHMASCMRRSGMPFMMNGDACNLKSNHRHLGYIRNSNLCLEIIQHNTPEEMAVCNLASISLKAFVKRRLFQQGHGWQEHYDWASLGQISRQLVINLNRVLDHNYYPCLEAKTSNQKHRPIGIGVSGLADAVYMLDLHYQHPDMKLFNQLIFACIYFNALAEGVCLAIKEGSYQSFPGSPFSEGKLQFDLWAEEYQLLKQAGYLNEKVRTKEEDLPLEPYLWQQQSITLPNGQVIEPTWSSLKEAIKKYGTRNSLYTALMPTASTSAILCNAETVEAHHDNIYCRKVINGEFLVANPHMAEDYQRLGFYNEEIIELICADRGSVRLVASYLRERGLVNPDQQPEVWARLNYLADKYLTMMELPTKLHLQLAADRGRYVDQSQSTNLYMADPSDQEIMASLLHANNLGLKTLCYYLRIYPSSDAPKTTIRPQIQEFVTNHNLAPVISRVEEPEPIPDQTETTYYCQLGDTSCPCCE